MNREDRERMVDRLLNEALAPQDVEPRAGLEGRILANLRAQPEPRHWWRWLWVPAAVAAAVLLVIILRPTHPPRPMQAPVVAEHQPAPPAPLKSIPLAPAVAAQRKPASSVGLAPRAITVAATRASQPRQAVFPSATPLTPEEKMLLTLLQGNPSEAVLVAREQAMEWERVLKSFQTGEATAPPSIPAEDMH
ncbi:MAG: hypothetical protein LAO06_13610 [Acidobacteriia bacterium]|nr:hypothetical protein [Terriglobia bacterium]